MTKPTPDFITRACDAAKALGDAERMHLREHEEFLHALSQHVEAYFLSFFKDCYIQASEKNKETFFGQELLAATLVNKHARQYALKAERRRHKGVLAVVACGMVKMTSSNLDKAIKEHK